MSVKVLWHYPQVPVEKVEELLLHQVDLGDREAKVLVPSDGGVPRPVLVLRRRVVKILSREDERGQEDPMHGTAHTLGHRWEP